MNGCIFSIEEFSIYDGPGIRTTVFLKGCPMRCQWCHSPEGQSPSPEIVKSPNGCLGCGSCTKNGRFENGRFVFTSESISSCPRNLLRVCGEEYTPQELTDKLLKNRKILAGCGGVTFSGGEPLMQSGFLTECLALLKGKLNCAVQTCGYGSHEDFKKILGLADLILFDLKIIDNDLHKHYIGCGNEPILRNFELLSGSGVEHIIRIPLIPGVTDTESNIRNIAELMRAHGEKYAELMPYHKMTGSKYPLAGRVYSPEFDTTASPDPRSDIFGSFGIKIKIL